MKIAPQNTPSTALQGISYWAEKTPGAVAITCDGKSINYQKLAIDIFKFSRLFKNLGVKKGAFVGVDLSSQDRALEMVLTLSLESIGALRITHLSNNNILNLCTFIFTSDKTKKALNRSSLIYIDEKWIENALSAVPPDDLRIFSQGPCSSDPIFLNSTSGTTGEKKFFFESYQAKQCEIDFIKNTYFPGQINNFFSLYNFSISSSYIGCKIALIKGGSCIFTALNSIMAENVEGGSSHCALLLRDAFLLRKFNPTITGAYKLASCRVFGAHLPSDLRGWLEERFSTRVVNSYSSNESGQIACMNSNGIGKIYPNVFVKIVDQFKQEVNYGEIGRITIKSEMQIKSYLFQDKLNAEFFDGDWYFSNDAGRMLAPGFIEVVDRIDQVLNLGGIKIGAQQLENKIKVLCEIEDCALFMTKFKKELNTILIFLEMGKALDFQNIYNKISTLLNQYSVKYKIYYLKDFPRTESGKIKKNELEKMIGNSYSLLKKITL